MPPPPLKQSSSDVPFAATNPTPPIWAFAVIGGETFLILLLIVGLIVSLATRPPARPPAPVVDEQELAELRSNDFASFKAWQPTKAEIDAVRSAEFREFKRNPFRPPQVDEKQLRERIIKEERARARLAPPDLQVVSSDMLNKYLEGKEAADAIYKDKWIEVAGKVGAMSKDRDSGFGGLDRGSNFAFVSDGNSQCTVICFFDDRNALFGVSSGEEVIVRGRVGGVSGSIIGVHQCLVAGKVKKAP